MRKETKKMAAKQPYEGYTLPRSSEKGQPFVDFNKVIEEKLAHDIDPRKVKIVRKRRTNGRS